MNQSLGWRSTWLVLLAAVLLWAGDASAQEWANIDPAADWPWWRGVQRNGDAGARSLPKQFGDKENVIWKTPVPGRGHSSPIVVSGKVYLATADEQKQTQSVLAYDVNSGKPLWTKQLSQGGFPAYNHAKNTEASTTLASDGKRLFVALFHHKQIELCCLELSGDVKWRIKVCDFDPKKYRYGYAPSPLLYEDLVIVAAEYDGPSGIAAYDSQTGKRQWVTPRPNNITFSSPVVANVAGQDQLLISGSQLVSAYSPKDGKELWSVAGTTAATCGTMVWDGDIVYASGGYPKAETIAIKADGSREVLWRNNQKCYEQSMIVVDGYLYGLTDKGVLYCWAGDDGTEQWRVRLEGPVSASPIYAGGLIYWANEYGTMFVFRPSPEKFELVAENRVGNSAFASPAVTGNRLLLRVAEGRMQDRQEFLVCIGESP